MQKDRIRLGKTDSVSSVNVDNKVVVELQQTTKPLIYTSLKGQVDQYEVFSSERENCVQYRLITTISPYCTNILYNHVTEIVKDEGDKECKRITDANRTESIEKCYGSKTPNRAEMIRNTEYSRETIGYEYHPGGDIFNNHILRNKSFKVVQPIKDTTNRGVFNTMSDFLRNYDYGAKIYYQKRSSIENISRIPKHLYDHNDIMSITDSVNNNLLEDNGWFGFVNKSTILTKKKCPDPVENERVKWEDEDFNHVINNKESCEFIDLYPDRTLFSFNPKYNTHRHRPEYNWKLCLTYPYKNFYDHNLIKDNNGGAGIINALLINGISYITGPNGEGIVMFNTLTKHNINEGDFINVYYKEKLNNGEYNKIEEIRITNIGDLEQNNKDYYFYTTDLNFLINLGFKDEEVYEQIREDSDEKEYEDFSKEDLTEELNNTYIFRFKHLINGYESEYYIRIFHKLPNLLKKEDKLSADDANNVSKLDEFLEKGLEFDKEQYQLAFASTIYNDNKTQLTFTDGINVENLLDNRGRPVSEIFLTILKNNKGNKEWYEKDDKTNEYKYENFSEDVEFSHCFSELSCGFDLYFNDFSTNAENSDVKTLNNCHHNGYHENFGWECDKYLNISEEDNTFIGDLVEFNITECNEVTLEECNFRFNTYLREYGENLAKDYMYTYDEIYSDDYDRDGFEVREYRVKDNRNLTHPEGYFYKAHYKIPLKEYGELNQASHFDLKVKQMYLDRINTDVVLFIRTTLPHHLSYTDTLLVCDDQRNRILKANIVSIKDSTTFAISAIGELTCQNIYDILNGEYEDKIQFKLRRYNSEIPTYAEKYENVNRYMWRTLNSAGNKNNVILPEYPFANGYLYINQEVNFFLKRQDPFNEIGLYYNGNEDILPNDVFGNILTPSEYEYKDETEATC